MERVEAAVDVRTPFLDDSADVGVVGDAEEEIDVGPAIRDTSRHRSRDGGSRDELVSTRQIKQGRQDTFPFVD
jgi:hypothetical protein